MTKREMAQTTRIHWDNDQWLILVAELKGFISFIKYIFHILGWRGLDMCNGGST